jgi:hypothetical protein
MVRQPQMIRARKGGVSRARLAPFATIVSAPMIGLACLATATTTYAQSPDEACDAASAPASGRVGPAERSDRPARPGLARTRRCGPNGADTRDAASRAGGGANPSTEPSPTPAGADPSVRRGSPFGAPGLSVQRAADLFARDENLAVLDRPHPEWDPLGIRAGTFVALPSVRVEAAYDDNVFATANNAKADAFVAIEPRLEIASDWNQNAVSLKAQAILERYATYPTLDNDQYSIIGDGLLNVRHDLTVTGQASHARTLIPRTADAYAQQSITPLLYDETTATVRATKAFNYLKLSATGTFADVRYENGETPTGATLNQSFQNRTTYTGTLRGEVATSTSVAFFVQETVGFSTLQSDLRSHNETETLVGPNFQVAHLITAEFGVGYLTSTYANPQARSVSSFTGRGAISYFPTELITVKLTGRQVVIDSGLVNSPAYLSRQAGLEADYELLRNLVIIGSLGGIWDSYQVIDRRDFNYAATLQAKYKVSHGLAFDLTVARRQRFSSGVSAGRGFVDDIATVGVTVQK